MFKQDLWVATMVWYRYRMSKLAVSIGSFTSVIWEPQIRGSGNIVGDGGHQAIKAHSQLSRAHVCSQRLKGKHETCMGLPHILHVYVMVLSLAFLYDS